MWFKKTSKKKIEGNLVKIYFQFYLKCLQNKTHYLSPQNKLIQKKKKKIKKGNYDTRKKKKPYPHAQNVCDEASINGIN